MKNYFEHPQNGYLIMSDILQVLQGWEARKPWLSAKSIDEVGDLRCKHRPAHFMRFIMTIGFVSNLFAVSREI
jgi:hypothetical protein